MSSLAYLQYFYTMKRIILILIIAAAGLTSVIAESATEEPLVLTVEKAVELGTLKQLQSQCSGKHPGRKGPG